MKYVCIGDSFINLDHVALIRYDRESHNRLLFITLSDGTLIDFFCDKEPAEAIMKHLRKLHGEPPPPLK